MGDAVGNMRSALDYVAYELARHHVGEIDDEEEAATSFPIFRDDGGIPEVLLRMEKRARSAVELYGDVERRALQCVQPFALTDEACALGVGPSTDPRGRLADRPRLRAECGVEH